MFGGVAVMWLVCPTPSVICLSFAFKFSYFVLCFFGLVMRWPASFLVIILFLCFGTVSLYLLLVHGLCPFSLFRVSLFCVFNSVLMSRCLWIYFV